MDSEAIVCNLAHLPSSGNNTIHTLSEASSPVDKFDKLVNFAALLIPVFLGFNAPPTCIKLLFHCLKKSANP